MAEFQEDMLFKNVSDVDANILLEIMGKKSKRTKVWTKELRHIELITFIYELKRRDLYLNFYVKKIY